MEGIELFKDEKAHNDLSKEHIILKKQHSEIYA